jgi:hypothetical protein
MRKALPIFILVFTSLTGFGQTKTDGQQRDTAFYYATSKWLSAWKLTKMKCIFENKN